MKVGILVNTCDRFSDCWELFFYQWLKHRNGVDWPLYLNTEQVDYVYPEDVQGRALKVCCAEQDEEAWNGDGYPTWSWCVERALNRMPEDIVLYMQEDYFLIGDLDADKLNEIVSMMEMHSDIECVHLHVAGNSISKPCDYSGLRKTSRWDRYFVSCQAALWRKSVLKKLLRMHENAWQFERWGTCRARVLACGFYTAARAGYSPVDYFCTGVVQGKWLHPVEDVFTEAGIKMDFSKRGFWQKRKGLWAHLKWILQKIQMRIWPPRSLMSVIGCLLSSRG